MDWSRKRIAECRERAAARPAYTDREREAGKRLAKELLLKKCRYFAERMGVSYGTVTVREQDVDKRQQRIRLEGELPSPVDPPEGCRFINRCRFASERCRKERP